MKFYKKIVSFHLKYFVLAIIICQLITSGSTWASDNMNSALEAIDKEEHETAISHLKNELKQNSNNIQARFLLGRTHLDIGNFSLADKELGKAYRLDRDNPEIALEYARILLAKNNYSKVKGMLAFKFDDVDLEIKRHVILAYTLIAEDNVNEAKELFNQSLKIKESNSAYVGLIKIELLKKNSGEADKLIKNRLKVNAQDQDVLLLKALLAKRNHKYQEALGIYDILLEKNPNNLSVALQRAAIRIIVKDYKGAQSDIDPVLKINEYHLRANYLLAQCKLSEHDYASAKKLSQTVLDLSNQHYPSMLILGLANMGLAYYNQAEKYLTQYLTVYPDNIYAQNLLANVFLAQNNAEQAVFILESIDDEVIQNNPAVLLTLGGAYLSVGEYSKGLDLLNKVKILSPEQYRKTLLINDQYINAYMTLALIAEQKGDINNVETLLKKGYEELQGDFKAQFTMATFLSKWYIRQKENKKLIKLSDELVKKYPDKIKVYSFQAQILIKIGDTHKAEQVLKQIIVKENKDIRHRLLLADIISKQPEREQAVLLLLDEIAEIEPEQSRILELKTAYLIKLKHYSQAIESSHQLQKKFPELAIGKQLEGDVFLSRGETDKALVFYQEAYQVQATNKLLSKIIVLMKENGQEKQSIKLLQTELEKNSKNISAHFHLAKIYQQNKIFEKAIKHYLSILDEQSNNAVVLNNLAWIYQQQNNPKSIVFAKKAYSKKPLSAEISDTYGKILVQQGKVKDGLAILKRASEILPEENNIQFHLAEAYYQNGDKHKAVGILEKITTSEQNFSEQQQAIELLSKLKN